MRRGLKRWLGLAVTAAVLGLIVYNLTRSPEWRTFDWGRLMRSLVHARRGFLLAAVGATLSSYLVRAYRWRFFLNPVKENSSLWNLFVGQILGFSSIYLIGRPGEFVRPAYIAEKEDVSISSMLAVWLLERVYDVVFMILLFVVALHYAPLHLTGAHAGRVLERLHRSSRLMLLGTALAVAALTALRLRAEMLAAHLGRVLRFLPGRIGEHVRNIFRSFVDGLEVISDWKDLLASLFSTAVLWFVNISMVWLVFRSLNGDLDRLTWMAAAVVLFGAAVGLVVQLPGVGGGYQVGAVLALRHLFGIHGEAATGAAILLWIVMSAPCLAVGLVLLAYEGLSFKKLHKIAEEKRAEVAGKS